MNTSEIVWCQAKLVGYETDALAFEVSDRDGGRGASTVRIRIDPYTECVLKALNPRALPGDNPLHYLYRTCRIKLQQGVKIIDAMPSKDSVGLHPMVERRSFA